MAKPKKKKKVAKKAPVKKATKKRLKRGREKGSAQNASQPLQLTQKIIDSVCACVAKGNFRKTAFGREGIAMSTWSGWTRAGRKDLREVQEGNRTLEQCDLKAELVKALIKAEATLHDKMLQNILKCGIEEDESKHKDRQFKFMRYRWPKEYNANPAAHLDDETGEESKVEPVALLSAKIQELLDR